MIRDLSKTLEQVLRQSGLPTELAVAQISFERPVESYSPSQTTVNLFLYDIGENVELRSNEPTIERVNGEAVIHRPPLRVACSYLVTAWPVGGTDLALQEHRLLSQVLQVFSQYPTIPASFLQGDLLGQAPPLPMVTAQADGLQNPAEFWTALGNKLRPSLTVTMTISMPVFADVTGPIVTTKITGFDVGTGVVEETVVQIGGRVLGPQVAAVRAQATLSAASNNQVNVTAAGDAANFRSGDVVFLEHATDTTIAERARIVSISGTTITLQVDLTNPYPVNSTIRIADLIRGQRRIRVGSTTGIQSDTNIRITQGTTTEARVVQSLDQTNSFITLGQGLTNTYTMAAADAPVSARQGIPGALVDIVDGGLRTTTDTEGRYSFTRVPVDTHTIRVVAVGFEPKTQPLVVPGRPEDYEVTLTPL